jgi:hypothetical protein
MSNTQLRTVLKAVTTVLRLTGKAIVYLAIALYVIGELLFSELETKPAPVAVEQTAPVRTVAKTMAPTPVLAIELPAVELETEPSDADKETIAQAADARHYATLTAVQLRKECGRVGIKWRNAHAPSKHLTKSEMLQALAA